MDANNSIKGVSVTSSFVDLSRDTISVRVANVSKKENVIKKSEVLTTCPSIFCIHRLQQLTTAATSEILNNELLKRTELNVEQRHAEEKLNLKVSSPEHPKMLKELN